MADDATVSIRIAGAIDSSLTASTEAAKSSLADLAASGNAAADTLGESLKEGFTNFALAAIAAARDTASEIIANDRISSQQKLADAKAVWDRLLAGDKLNAQQRAQAKKTEAADAREIDRQSARDQEEIDRGQVNTQLQLAKIAIEGEKAVLEQSVGYNQLSAAQKLAIQKAYYDREMQQEIDALEVDMESMDASTKVYRDKENQIAVLTAQRAQKDIQYGIQESNAEIGQWRSTDEAIESAESQLVSDIFSKRQGLGRDLRQIGLKLLEQEVQDDTKALTQHILTNLGMVASDQQAAQAGGLAHLAEWGAQQSGAGVAGANSSLVTAGSGAGQVALAANTQALAALYQAITGHVLATTTNTSALTVGTGATTTNTGAAITHTGATLSGAAATASNTAVQSTGIIAWTENTAATIANTIATDAEAIGSFLGFASGADNIPNDMVAQIHKGEMIIPAATAALVRAGNIGIGEMANLAASGDLTPVDPGGSPSLASRSDMPARSFGDTGNAARGGDSYNLGGLHIHGFDLPSIAHNPAFQREAMKIVRNMHRNAVRR